jgi:hypothetical protein
MRLRLTILMALGATLLAGACGESGGDGAVPSAATTGAPAPGASASATPSGAYAQALAFAQCMRDNGLPDFPDPDPSGGLGVGGTTVDRGSAQYQNAIEACQDLRPAGTDQGETNTEQLDKMRAYAACIRQNGVPDFPDPGPDGFDPSTFANNDDPAFVKAQEACKEFLTWR